VAGRLGDQGAELESEPLSCPPPPVDESTVLVTEIRQHRFSLVLR